MYFFISLHLSDSFIYLHILLFFRSHFLIHFLISEKHFYPNVVTLNVNVTDAMKANIFVLLKVHNVYEEPFGLPDKQIVITMINADKVSL